MRLGFLCLILFTAVPFFAQGHTDASQLEANKKLALAFFEVGPKGPDAMAQFLAPDYIQHNPRFVQYNDQHNVTGREGFVAGFKGGALGARPPAGQTAGATPQLPPRKPALVMAEGDLVTIVWQQKRPDPNDGTKTYNAFAFDTFRIKDGKLAEHWDGAILDSAVPPRN